MTRFVLVSGIGMSNGGVGRLMRRLEPLAAARGYKILSRRMVAVKPLFAARRYFRLVIELFLRMVSLIIFKINLFFFLAEKHVLFCILKV